MSTSELTRRVIELQNQQYKFVPDSCPEGITFEMLMEEIRPEENYEKSDKNRNELWATYCIVCLSPNPFGFYVDKEEIDKNNENIIIPWYKLESEGKN